MPHSPLMWSSRARVCAPTFPQVNMYLSSHWSIWRTSASDWPASSQNIRPVIVPMVSCVARGWEIARNIDKIAQNLHTQNSSEGCLGKTENCTFLIIRGCGLSPESREQALGNEYHNQIDGLPHYWHNWIIHSLSPTWTFMFAKKSRFVGGGQYYLYKVCQIWLVYGIIPGILLHHSVFNSWQNI